MDTLVSPDSTEIVVPLPLPFYLDHQELLAELHAEFGLGRSRLARGMWEVTVHSPLAAMVLYMTLSCWKYGPP